MCIPRVFNWLVRPKVQYHAPNIALTKGINVVKKNSVGVGVDNLALEELVESNYMY